jgi:hypothetical protein
MGRSLCGWAEQSDTGDAISPHGLMPIQYFCGIRPGDRAMSTRDIAYVRRIERNLRGIETRLLKLLAERVTHGDDTHYCGELTLMFLAGELGCGRRSLYSAIKDLTADLILKAESLRDAHGHYAGFKFWLLLADRASLVGRRQRLRDRDRKPSAKTAHGPWAKTAQPLSLEGSLNPLEGKNQSATAIEDSLVAITTSSGEDQEPGKIEDEDQSKTPPVAQPPLMPWAVSLPHAGTVCGYTKYWEDLVVERFGKVYVAPLEAVDASKLDWLITRAADPKNSGWCVAELMRETVSDWSKAGQLFANVLGTSACGGKGYPPKPSLSYFVKGLLEVVRSMDQKAAA